MTRIALALVFAAALAACNKTPGTTAATKPVSGDAWAVVNGRAYVLVTNGIWAGAWLPEEVVLAYER